MTPAEQWRNATQVTLLFLHERVNVWLRFGSPQQEIYCNRSRRIATFAPPAIFCRVHWEANAYGTTLWRISVMQVGDHREPLQRVLGTWHLRPDWDATLRSLGERGDIIRTLQRAMGSAAREMVVFDGSASTQTIVGRIAGKGLIDELTDRGYLAVDATDGRAHYVALPNGHNLTDYPLGAIVEARAGGVRAIDEAIVQYREGDFYRPDRVRDPDQLTAQVRRLEALRRAGIVDRLQNNLWKIPDDLAERGRDYDAKHAGGAIVTLRSHLPIEQQIRANGATWLDQQLTTQKSEPPAVGFGTTVRDALGERAQFLVEQGLARRSGQRIVLARNLLATLRERELFEVARAIQAETSLTYRPAVEGARIQGTYRRSVQLVSGRYALIDDGSGFSLVPWRPVVDKHLGRSLAATVSGHRVSWSFENKRGIPL